MASLIQDIVIEEMEKDTDEMMEKDEKSKWYFNSANPSYISPKLKSIMNIYPYIIIITCFVEHEVWLISF